MVTKNQAGVAEHNGLKIILRMSGDMNVSIKEFQRCLEYDDTLDTFAGTLAELYQLIEKLELAREQLVEHERTIQNYDQDRDLGESNAEALSSIGV